MTARQCYAIYTAVPAQPSSYWSATVECNMNNTLSFVSVIMSSAATVCFAKMGQHCLYISEGKPNTPAQADSRWQNLVRLRHLPGGAAQSASGGQKSTLKASAAERGCTTCLL